MLMWAAQINVYELGHVFKALNDIYSFESNNVKSIIPEDLMFRFADKLDFGEFTVSCHSYLNIYI